MLKPPVILTAPPEWGKTRNAKTLCTQLGCSRVVDDFNPSKPYTLRPGTLYLTNVPPDQVRFFVNPDVTVVSRGWA